MNKQATIEMIKRLRDLADELERGLNDDEE